MKTRYDIDGSSVDVVVVVDDGSTLKVVAIVEEEDIIGRVADLRDVCVGVRQTVVGHGIADKIIVEKRTMDIRGVEDVDSLREDKRGESATVMKSAAWAERYFIVIWQLVICFILVTEAW